MKTYYELLGVARDAPANEIKQAFRRAIAKYHPDKVQHLGEEFQQLAQERASELTIAYKTLIDEARRAEYDAVLGQSPESMDGKQSTAGEQSGVRSQWTGSAPKPEGGPESGVSGRDAVRSPESDTDDLRHDRDLLLKRAALARADQLLRQALPDSEPAAASGFDLGYYSRPPKLFGQPKPWVLARFIPRFDAAIARDVWSQACRSSDVRQVPVCVFLLSGCLPAERELATLLTSNSRASRGNQKVTVVPVDVRDWRAFVPRDADPGIKSLAKSLGRG